MANLNPITITTLSVALPSVQPGRVDPGGTIVTPVSMTNVLAPGPNKSNRTILWMDREAFEVIAITTTTATCHRGVYGTLKTSHLAGTLVWVGSESDFSYFNQEESSYKAGLGLYSKTTVSCETANPFAATATATITAAQMLAKLVVGTPTAAANYTVDTATNIIAGLACFSNPFIGQYFEFIIVNTSAGANTITLVAGTGVTLVGGTVTVAQNASRRFGVLVTNVVAPAVSIYQVS